MARRRSGGILLPRTALGFRFNEKYNRFSALAIGARLRLAGQELRHREAHEPCPGDIALRRQSVQAKHLRVRQEKRYVPPVMPAPSLAAAGLFLVH